MQGASVLNEIAVIGMDCYFPGAEGLTQFWDLLCEGKNVVHDLPSWRCNSFCAEPFKGGYVKDLARFDADFFGITEREAKRMDPQQRMLLEISWRALEDAAILPSQLRKTRTGVFVGVMGNEWAQLMYAKPEQVDVYAGIGNGYSIIANRLSYFYDLNGPSMAIDTACSSALTAINTACIQLQMGEIDLAIVGGVNVVISSALNHFYREAGLADKDGYCKPFGEKANGIVRGEGAGIVILKRVADMDTNHRAYAHILGSAVNHDGKSNGLTAPNRWLQEDVLRRAYHKAGIAPSIVDYIEAHGTGTALGDPIEEKALAQVLGNRDGGPLLIGSVKSNFGHLEGASGIAGFIKAVLSIYHKKIPPTLHVGKGNPYINFKKDNIKVVSELTNWPMIAGKKVIAGVSAFGLGGSNAHVVLSEARRIEHNFTDEDITYFIKLSAKSETSLKKLAIQYKHYLQTLPDENLSSFCHTNNVFKTDHCYRLAISGDSKDMLLTCLQNIADKTSFERCQASVPGLVALFTGQGEIDKQMFCHAYRDNSVFKAYFDKCNDLLKAQFNISLYEKFIAGSPLSDLTEHAEYYQVALFIYEYAMAKSWEDVGVIADLMLGHSLGEYVAACLSGVFSLADGLNMLVMRGKLMQQCKVNSAMLAVSLPSEKLTQLIVQRQLEVEISVCNGATHTVISGSLSSIEHAKQYLSQQHIPCVLLPVQAGFHSKFIEEMLPEFREFLKTITFHRPTRRIISSLTGQWMDEEYSPDYWCRHAREPVQFHQCMLLAKQEGFSHFIEMGPTNTLCRLGKNIFGKSEVSWYWAVAKEDVDQAASAIYQQGYSINWASLSPTANGNLLSMPTYSFSGKWYWFDDKGYLSSLVPLGRAEELIKESIKNNDGLAISPDHLVEKIYDVISSVAEVEKSSLCLETNLRQQLGFDSLTSMRLKSTLDGEIPLAKLISPAKFFKMATISDLINAIRECKNEHV